MSQPVASSSVPSTDQQMLAQSRALGDPTRHAIFVHVRDASSPVTVAELTAHFGLNHNAIRQHVAKLCGAGLVIEHHEPPSGPGRPPVRYRPVAGVAERWGGPNPYEALSMMLVGLLHDGGSPYEAGRAAGQRAARQYGSGSATIDMLDTIGRQLGFEPRRAPGRLGGTDVILDRCPFEGAASLAPEVVCEIHRGFADGIGDCGDEHTVVAGLVSRPPQRAGCRIRTVTTQ